MKLLQINCVYKKGSTGKLVYEIHRAMLNDGYDSVVCYGRGEKTKDEKVLKSSGELYAKLNNLRSRFTGVMHGGCLFSTAALINIIKKQKPDIVHLHCINGFFVNIYKLLEFLKNSGIKTVLTLHAEFMYTASCGYSLECEKWKTGCGKCPQLKSEIRSFLLDNTALSWRKMKKAFEGFENLTVVSVSPWLKERAEISPILKGKNHKIVLNGVDTSVFALYNKAEIKKKLGFENKKIIFHATAFFSASKEHLKGGYYVVSMAKRFLKEDSDVVFLVAGRCEKIKEAPKNVIFLGNILDQERLAEYYSAADLTLLTSKKETFSMVVAESLCCGTPVVGFEAGAPEKITIKNHSSFVLHGDEEKLYEEIKKWLNKENVDKKAISDEAKAKYSKENMVKEYQKIYDEF